MRKLITGIIIIMLSALASQAVCAKPVGKFIKVEGRVDITRPGKPAEQVDTGAEIFEKDIIRSKSNSKAEILFKDGNVLRLAQKTRIEISEYIVDSESNKRSAILNLFRGKIQNKVKKLLGSIFGDSNNRYEVHTPTSVCGVRGTDFFMYYQKGVSGAAFKEGFGYGYNRSKPDSVIEVQAGQSMIIADTNAPPVLRTVSQVEINQLEEETTPVEEEETADEEKNSGEADSNVIDENEENVTQDDESAPEEGDSNEAESEIAENDETDSNVADEESSKVSESNEPESDIPDEGSATAEETGQPDLVEMDADPGSAGDLSEEVVAMADSAGDTAVVEDAAPATDTGFVPSDSSVSSGTILEDGDLGGFVTEDILPDPVLTDDPVENTVLATNNVTTDTVDTNPVVDDSPVDIPQEIPEVLAPATTSTDTTTTDTTTTDTTTTDTTTTDTTTDTTITDTTITDTTTTDTTPTDPAPLMTVSGKLMGIAPGTFTEGEYILPHATDPHRMEYMGPMEDARHEYEYFRKDDGTFLMGFKEEYHSDTDSWTMYDYLPDGTFLTEVEGPDGYAPTITESTWSGDLSFLADQPTGYFLRYQNEFASTMITGIGNFTGDVLGVSSELWSSTQSAPLDISLSGLYTSTDTAYLFKSFVSGSFVDAGGTYSGFLSGKADDVTGFLHALYIKPDGSKLGILEGEFAGLVDTTGTWNATGTMYHTVISADPGTITNDNFLSSIRKGYLEVERLTGIFSGGNDAGIKGHGFGETSFLTGYDWGIFNMVFGSADYDESTVSSSWSGKVSGFGMFGEDDGGIWQADISNGTWLTDEISGDVSGKFLTMTKQGTIDGKLIGPGGSSGDWAAVSQGTWTKSKDLQFSSGLGGSIYYIHPEEGGNYYMATDESVYNYHYDLYSHEGGYQFYDAVNNQDIYMQTNAWDFDGTFADFKMEKWVYDHTSYGLISYTAGSWTDPLQYLRENPELYTGMTWDYHDQWKSYNMFQTGWLEGILGGLNSPWNANSTTQAGITILGFYEVPFYITPDQSVLYAQDIESFNPGNGSATTFDGGAYSGFMGGVLGSTTSGNIFTIYIDPNNNAGILLGKFQGAADAMSGVWYADGGIYPVQLYSGFSVTPDTLFDMVMNREYHFWDNNPQGYTTEDGTFFDASGSMVGYIELGGGHFFSKNIEGQTWGVWQNVIGGVYTGTSGIDWALTLHHEMYDDTGNVSGMIAKYGVSDGTWSNNKIDADVLGVWVDLNDVVVGLSSGKLAGTYDPTDSLEMTWQALGSGIWMKAGQFLDMAATPEGRAALAELNIPAIEIGKTTLTGTGSTISVTMNDVTFFSPSTGGAPSVWATGNINGTFSAIPAYEYVQLTDGQLFTDFNLKKWDTVNNTWVADISNGYGVLNRTDVAGSVNVEFNGLAGGIHSGGTSGTFSGEGAGVVR